MTGRTCSKCSRPARARGLCPAHHQQFSRDNPELRVMAIMRRAILAAMPATRTELAEKVGCDLETIRRWIPWLTQEKAIHIGSHRAPDKKGSRWVPVFHAGRGKDVVLTPEIKREHHLQGRRAREKINYMVRQKAALGHAHGWAAMLFVGVKNGQT